MYPIQTNLPCQFKDCPRKATYRLMIAQLKATQIADVCEIHRKLYFENVTAQASDARKYRWFKKMQGDQYQPINHVKKLKEQNNKFDFFFEKPVLFDDGSLVVNGSLSIHEAIESLQCAIGETLSHEQIESGFVRHGFPSSKIIGSSLTKGASKWHFSNKGHGSKKVWILRSNYD